MSPEEKEKRIAKAEGISRILARDAEIGKTYLTALLYKVEIIKKNGEEFGCTSVTVKSETTPGTNLNIAGGTELIPFDDDLYVPPTQDSTPATKSNKAKEKQTPGEKPMATKKENTSKIKMSDIITPMLLAGDDPETIADKVIAADSSRAGERAALLRQIKGPRRYNLIKKLKKEGKDIPAHLQEKSTTES